MARSLLVAPAAENVGLATTCLGLLHALTGGGSRSLSSSRWPSRGRISPDRSAALVTAITALCPPEPLTTAELNGPGQGGLDVVLEKIVAASEPSCAGSDVVVLEGLSSGSSSCTPVR